jgi:tetratricopeptide (TPR) repeat protein
LAPDCALGFQVRGLIKGQKRGDMKGAIRDLGRAVELGAGSDSLWILAYVCFGVGRMAEARRYTDRLVSVDPGHWGGRLVQAMLALMSGDLDAALLAVRSWVDWTADPLSRLWLGIICAYAGRQEEACDLFRQLAAAGAEPIHRMGTIYGAALRRDREAFCGALADSSMLDIGRTDKEFSWWFADCNALMGDTGEAVRWLENIIDLGVVNHRFFAESDPFLAPLRTDLRFQVVMDRMRERQRAYED